METASARKPRRNGPQAINALTLKPDPSTGADHTHSFGTDIQVLF